MSAINVGGTCLWLFEFDGWNDDALAPVTVRSGGTIYGAGIHPSRGALSRCHGLIETLKDVRL